MKAMRAYGHARIRAARSRIARDPDLLPLRFAHDEASTNRSLATLGIDPSANRDAQLFARVLRIYRVAIRAYHEPVFLALLRLHEVENLKLVWRAIVRGLPPVRWLPLWRDLEEFATLDRDALAHCTSLRTLLDAIAASPYAEPAERIAAAHPDDLAAAELALDRWANHLLRGFHEPLVDQLVAAREDDHAKRSLSGGQAILPVCRRRRPQPAPLLHFASLHPALETLLRAEQELRTITALAEAV